MAWELNGFSCGNLVANADLSAKQFYIVKMDTTNNQFALCDTDGENALGILQDKPESGIPGDIRMLGVSKVVAAEALTAGQNYGVDANGKAKLVEGTNTGADVGDMVLGQVVQGAAAGELAVVTVGLSTFRVESV